MDPCNLEELLAGYAVEIGDLLQKNHMEMWRAWNSQNNFKKEPIWETNYRVSEFIKACDSLQNQHL